MIRRVRRIGPWAAALALVAACRAGESAPGGEDAAVEAAPTGVAFTDVSEAAGIFIEHGPRNTPPSCLVDTVMPPRAGYHCAIDWAQAGVAIADLDDDGFPDFYASRLYAPGVLMHNDGDGTFSDVTLAAGLGGADHGAGALFADIDNDGDQDLFLASVGLTAHRLFINDGAAHFTDEATERGAALEDGFPQTGTSIGAGDYDDDGFLDLYVGDWHTHAVGTQPSHNRLLHNLGATMPGHFEDVTLAAGVSVDAVYLERGSASGTFVFSPAFMDMDEDGHQDLLLASDYGCSVLFWNEGDGTFTDGTLAAGVGTDKNGMGAAFGDQDGDGHLDWFITSIYGPAEEGNRLFRYAGGRRFEDATDASGMRRGGWGWGADLVDFENDGDLDAVMTAGWFGDAFLADPMVAFLNVGGGVTHAFSSGTGLTSTEQGRGLVTFDYDRDGDRDVLMANHAGPVVLYRNDMPDPGAWLDVRVIGTRSNRDALGARVIVTTETGERLHVIGDGSKFLGHGERIAHFGLGAAAHATRVRVTWPTSGASVEMIDVAAGQRIVITEPLE